MDEYSNSVNAENAEVVSSQESVETVETVNADNAEVTNGEQEQTAEGSNQTTDAQEGKRPEPHTQSKEENEQFAKVRKEAEARVRAEIEQQQAARDTEFAKRAAQFEWVDGSGNPIKTEDAYWKAVDAQTKIDALINSGKDPETARLEIERDEYKSEMAKIKNKLETEAKRNAENAEFFELFKEANNREFTNDDVVPPEVFIIANENNLPLPFAYSHYLTKQSIAEKKNIAIGKQTAEVNAKNATTSTGSITGTSSAEPEFYTKDQVAAMSSADVHKHFDKIEASMKRWA